MQFSAIRTYAATRFRDTSNQVVSDTDWKSYVNTAYGDVLTAMPYYPWNEASTSLVIAPNGREIALPTDAFRVTSVYDQTDQFPLVPLEGRDQVYNEYPQQTEVGQPMHYRIFAGKLQVYPLCQASTTFIVEYAVQPADLVLDADVPAIPAQYHDILVSGAVALAYKDDGNAQMSSAYQAEADKMTAALIRDVMQPRQGRFYEPVDTFL